MSEKINPVELSSRIIDTGNPEPPHNRVLDELFEVEDEVAVVESFSHCWAVKTQEGLVCVDASGSGSGENVVKALRGWSKEPINSLVYTHGHLDHVGGSGAFMDDADTRSQKKPVVIAHEAVLDRFNRYRLTGDWNTFINKRQFGGITPRAEVGTTQIGIGGLGPKFLPDSVADPEITYEDSYLLEVGGKKLELNHGRGETDDHTWVWDEENKTVFAGDFIIWTFPNAGNPQKVQRYALEWASVLREMISRGAERVYPAHGLPIVGRKRVEVVLGDMAEALEYLTDVTLELMNQGARLDAIIHEVRVPDHLSEKPWLAPLYDEPEFVVRNIYRLYGGWWDGDPSRLKPAPDSLLAKELVSLMGSIEALVTRAEELAENGEFRLACHLVELAVQSEPEHEGAQRARAHVYWQRRSAERSLMSKGIFAAAARESEATYGDVTPRMKMREAVRKSME